MLRLFRLAARPRPRKGQGPTPPTPLHQAQSRRVDPCMQPGRTWARTAAAAAGRSSCLMPRASMVELWVCPVGGVIRSKAEGQSALVSEFDEAVHTKGNPVVVLGASECMHRSMGRAQGSRPKAAVQAPLRRKRAPSSPASVLGTRFISPPLPANDANASSQSQRQAAGSAVAGRACTRRVVESRRGVWSRRSKEESLGVAVHLHRRRKHARMMPRLAGSGLHTEAKAARAASAALPPPADAMRCCAVLCALRVALLGFGLALRCVGSSIGRSRPPHDWLIGIPSNSERPGWSESREPQRSEHPPHLLTLHPPPTTHTGNQRSSSGHHGAGDDGARGRAGADADRGLQLPAGGGPGALSFCVRGYIVGYWRG